MEFYVLNNKSELSKHALNMWAHAVFSSIFLASSFLCFRTFFTLATAATNANNFARNGAIMGHSRPELSGI
jgi:hypothetical protein